MNDWNQNIIEEFRENGGEVGGAFAGAPLLLLHHVGARTGVERVCPLMYQTVDGGYAIFASKAGAASNPDWYYNLLVHPDVEIEVGSATIPVRARVARGAEHDVIWERQKRDRPQFAEYERKTSRPTIPVLVLEKR